MTAPTHSVIVPVKNGAAFIVECLASILAELGTGDELIVVDNGSTDGTNGLVEAMGDSRIQLLHESKPGPAAARNAALRVARGRYISFQDHDDLWPAGRQKLLLDTLQASPGVNASHGRVRIVFDGPIDPAYAGMDGQFVSQYNFLASVFDRTLIDRVGLMDETMLRSSDVDYLIRLRQAGMVSAFCVAIVHVRRRHATNWSSAERATVEANTMQILRRNIARKRQGR